MDRRELLYILAVHYQGEWNDIYNAIERREDITQFSDVLNIKRNFKYVTILDDEYPDSLKKIYKPPFVLFYYGDISLTKEMDNIVGIIGTREPSDYGINATRKIIDELDNEEIIVSGLASGIDGIAHDEALKTSHKTIAVLGSGIDICYPSENLLLYEKIKKKGLLLSEYPFKTPSKPSNFPVRNRLISGLAWGVVITEAKIKSGTMITASLALDQCKEVMCVPSPIGKESGANKLIKDGAYLVECGEDVKFIKNPQKTYPY